MEKLVVWEHNGKLFLVDGHHRFQIARKHGIPFQIAKKIGSLYGSSERKIYYAYEFAKAVDRVKQVNAKDAERILRGEVKDAITALPQIIKREKPEIVRKALEKIAEGEEKLKKAVMDVKIQKLREKAEQLTPPSGEYDVIVIDPLM